MPLAFPDELIIDNFAGGGGTSTGLEAAFGRPVDIAINHDPEVLALTPHQPLFGNTSGKKAGTHWLVFMKEMA